MSKEIGSVTRPIIGIGRPGCLVLAAILFTTWSFASLAYFPALVLSFNSSLTAWSFASSVSLSCFYLCNFQTELSPINNIDKNTRLCISIVNKMTSTTTSKTKTKAKKAATTGRGSKTSRLGDCNQYNGVTLPTGACERRRVRNKLTAMVHRKKKQDALNTAKEEVAACDIEINRLKLQLNDVSSSYIYLCLCLSH